MRSSLLSLLAGTAALAIAASAAQAADLPSRRAPAPIIAAVPVFTWTGFYLGVNAGAGWQNQNDRTVFIPGATPGFGPGGATIISTNNNDVGFVGGAQAGYNYQIGSFVVGLEADIQGTSFGGNNRTAFVTGTVPAGFIAASRDNGLDWFGTVRARAGVAFDRALIYATGGFAYGGGGDNNNFNGLVNSNDTRTGWVVGGGVEYAFTNNLTAGVEGLYVNLGRSGNNGVVGTLANGTPVFVAGVDNRRDNDFAVVRAKLNYKFSTY
ncbi:outer membrane protein [Microvirga sp. 2TAF3]|uniref:outer membrane protein n=1 Tax=Microvirga sp. 2TAF3 TaxID=3233014 RepID=UPI003F9E2117